MSTADIRLVKNYDRAAWFYEASAALFSGGQIRASKKYTAAQVKAGQKIIFLGVGTGEEAIIAAQRGAQVTCLDISSAMLERLEARLHRRNLKAEIICQDAFQHDRIGYYDAVATNYFLNVFRQDGMRRMLNYDYAKYFPDAQLKLNHIRYFRLFRGGPVVFQTWVATKKKSR